MGRARFSGSGEDDHQLICFIWPNGHVFICVGLSAVVAAVMSSLDSIILSSSSMFTHNVYRMSLKPKVCSMVLRVCKVRG